MWELDDEYDGAFSEEDRAIIRARGQVMVAAYKEWNQGVNRDLLKSDKIKEFIAKGFVTDWQIIELSANQRLDISSEGIVKLIDYGIISFAKALKLQLSMVQRDFLSTEGICELIINQIISLDRVLKLSRTQRFILESRGIRSLLSEKIITLDQTLALSPNQIRALNDLDTVQRIIIGDLNIQQFVGEIFFFRRHHINHVQSTHTASVHNTVSESAEKLRQRYADKVFKKSSLEKILQKSGLKNIIRKLGIVSKSGLEKVLREIKAFIDALPNNDPRKKAATHCIARITNWGGDFVDPLSKLSTKELLALSFVAIRDNKYHQSEIEDAENRFIEGLVEIQRGYNSSATEEDKPICASGAFNKLIESLQGVHQDCTIQYMTEGTASLKLPVVVREELDSYLLNLICSAKNEAVLIHLEKLIQKVQQSGNSKSFLQKIEKKIAIRILDEFASLYPFGKLDHNFIKLVSFTKEVDVSAVLEKNLVYLRKKRQSISAFQQQSPLSYDWDQSMPSQAVSPGHNVDSEAENQLPFPPGPETGAIPRRRYKLENIEDTLSLVQEMDALSLIPDKFGSATQSGHMPSSNFWQPKFATSTEDNVSFAPSDALEKSSGVRSKNL